MKKRRLQARRSPGQRIKLTDGSTRRRAIKCHDCGKPGHIELYSNGDHTLPPGWAMAWIWFKPLFTCPTCGEKRRQWVRDNIIRRETT